MPDYLHRHPNFADLIRIVGRDLNIGSALVEKDYWIMHCLYGLRKQGFKFELKGGTSLSKGYGIIQRFSEDIDIRIEPPAALNVKTGRNHNNPAHCKSRSDFYDWLAKAIHIDGMDQVTRDEAFDDMKYRSGGIRLHYDGVTEQFKDMKQGILLEVGFDDVEPNQPLTISSWAYGHAANLDVEVIDNRAHDICCYLPGFTLVEKLQAISTKFRQQQAEGTFPGNFMRHYYDVYCLLQDPSVQQFIASPDYLNHKNRRFRGKDQKTISENPAFVMTPKNQRRYELAYMETPSLYYKGQPPFDRVMDTIKQWAAKL